METLYCWACDISENTGEGNLARIFLKKKAITYKIYVFNVKKIFSDYNFLFNIFNYRYIAPVLGVGFCWYLFLKKKKIAFIKYIPLWNFFFFLFLPPKTILGPITGGSNFKEDKNFIRRYIFPYLYKISEFFLNIRLQQIYFSTDLLKPFLKKSTILKSHFNYVFKLINPKHNSTKDIDFLIYYRKHPNKEDLFPYNFIKKLISRGFRISVIGDHLNLRSVINYGRVKNKFVNMLLSKTFFTLASNENLYSLFIIESINNRVKIIIDSNQFQNIKFYKQYFVSLNFNKYCDLSSLKNIKLTNNNPII
jgi:hypothetical protein